VSNGIKWQNSRDTPIQLLPNPLGLRLNTFDRIDENNRTVDNSACAFDLHTKVRVAGCIDEIYVPVLPFDWNTGGLYRYAALALSRQEVGRGAPVVDRAGL
jgi:hypothetical protein